MLSSVVQELNEEVTQFLEEHSFDVQMLVYQWHDGVMQAKLKRALRKLETRDVLSQRRRHNYSVRVMALQDTLHTAVQCAEGAMVCTGHPVELIAGDLAFVNLNSQGDDVGAKIVYSTKKKCFVLRVATYVITNVWISVGRWIPGINGGGMPAMILQEDTVIRVGTHHFRIVHCKPVRAHLAFKYMIAPVDRKKRQRHSESTQLLSVEDQIAEDEETSLSIQCVHPHNSPCYRKMLKFQYNQGGHELKIGDSDVCAFQIVDGSVKGVTTRIKALLGHFWLLDGPADRTASLEGTFVQVTPVSDPVPLRSSFGLMRLVFEPLNGARRVSADIEIVETASD